MSRDAPRPSRAVRAAALLAASLLFHVLVWQWGAPLLGAWGTDIWTAPIRIEVLDGDPLASRLDRPPSPLDATPPTLEEPVPPPPEEPERLLPDGQIVETPRPDEERVPLKSEYLAEHDNAVPEETRSQRYRINPEVLANQYSEESKYQTDDVIDVGATNFSTGATAGSPFDRPDGEGAPRSALPTQWSITNKEGLASPVPSSSSVQSLSGAPQNDLLDEKNGDTVALNTRAFIGADYINRVRRAVNFYWKQNLDNLSSSVPLTRSQYRTEVDIVLNGRGQLESIKVTDGSGNDPVDLCVVDAFRIAGPFPNPPAQLVSRDGRVYLPEFDFTVQVSNARLQYQGIDPRAGVQFPGILKSPR